MPLHGIVGMSDESPPYKKYWTLTKGVSGAVLYEWVKTSNARRSLRLASPTRGYREGVCLVRMIEDRPEQRYYVSPRRQTARTGGEQPQHLPSSVCVFRQPEHRSTGAIGTPTIILYCEQYTRASFYQRSLRITFRFITE